MWPRLDSEAGGGPAGLSYRVQTSSIRQVGSAKTEEGAKRPVRLIPIPPFSPLCRLVSSVQAIMASTVGYIVSSSCKHIIDDQ